MRTQKEFQAGHSDEIVVVETPNKSCNLVESTEMVSVERMVPGLTLSHNALVVHKERQDLYANIISSYSETSQRIGNLVEGWRQDHPLESILVSPLARIVADKSAIASLRGVDALEDVRVQLGLDKLRDELMERLRGKLSWKSGLAMISDWIYKRFTVRCQTVQEVNAYFPNLTLSELAFFPLLNELPLYMLLFGTEFDPLSVSESRLFDNIGLKSKRRIPQQLWATTQGIAYVLDDYASSMDDKGILEYDPYTVLGLTGISETVEVSGYSSWVRSIIAKLVPLTISNRRMYERVWNSSPEATQVGLGRIAKVALSRILPAEEMVASQVSLQATIALLSNEQKILFEQERTVLERTIVSASIFDLGRDVVLRPDEVVKLVGILSQVPGCVIAEMPFRGFIQPYGATIRFMDLDGNILETCPLASLYGREAAVTLYAEEEDSSRENTTIVALFKGFMADVQKDIMENVASELENLSLLESVVVELWLERGVLLQVLPVGLLKAVRDFREDMFEHSVTAKDLVFRFTSKIGLHEAQQCAMILKLLGRQLLGGVDRVIKKQYARSIAESMDGMVMQGQYDCSAKTITLRELVDCLFGDIPSYQKVARAFVLLHECGESLWPQLDEKIQGRWRKISWPRKKRSRVEKHFLTFYAHHKDEKEDFCDHFAAFVLHGPEFRLAANKSGPLRRKYRMMRSILKRILGSVVEYPSLAPWTIREVHGAIEQQVEKMRLAEAIELEEEQVKSLYREKREHIFEIRKSFENVFADEDKDPEEDEDSDDSEDEEDEEDFFEEADEDEVDGLMEAQELRSSVTDILESFMDEDDKDFRLLRNDLYGYILDSDWEAIKESLDFLCDEEKDEVLSQLRDIAPHR